VEILRRVKVVMSLILHLLGGSGKGENGASLEQVEPLEVFWSECWKIDGS
jgi:hypothetical protein